MKKLHKFKEQIVILGVLIVMGLASIKQFGLL
jgi:hypothetical protein